MCYNHFDSLLPPSSLVLMLLSFSSYLSDNVVKPIDMMSKAKKKKKKKEQKPMTLYHNLSWAAH